MFRRWPVLGAQALAKQRDGSSRVQDLGSDHAVVTGPMDPHLVCGGSRHGYRFFVRRSLVYHADV